MVYLDYNATTPLAQPAREAMLPYLDGEFGNPSSIHAAGRRARAAIDEARDDVAEILGVRPSEIIFTSGGTESCNLGVIGLARAHAVRGKHIITSATEHHAILHAFEFLRHFEDFEVTVLRVGRSGLVDPAELERAIRPDTTLVSLMHANNETGVIQPLPEIGEICKSRRVLLHTDAVQTFGKIPVNPAVLGVSALSIAAHKFYGPKGAGVLWLDSGVALSRLGHGGSHENSRRPGTENVAAIAGLAAAARFAIAQAHDVENRVRPLRDELWHQIHAASPHAIRNGDPAASLANTLNVSFPGADGESLLIGLDLHGVCASSGSACMVGSVQASHVLLAMGVPKNTALATVRFSLGSQTTPGDVQRAASAVRSVVELQTHSASCDTNSFS